MDCYGDFSCYECDESGPARAIRILFCFVFSLLVGYGAVALEAGRRRGTLLLPRLHGGLLDVAIDHLPLLSVFGRTLHVGKYFPAVLVGALEFWPSPTTDWSCAMDMEGAGAISRLCGNLFSGPIPAVLAACVAARLVRRRGVPFTPRGHVTNPAALDGLYRRVLLLLARIFFVGLWWRLIAELSYMVEFGDVEPRVEFVVLPLVAFGYLVYNRAGDTAAHDQDARLEAWSAGAREHDGAAPPVRTKSLPLYDHLSPPNIAFGARWNIVRPLAITTLYSFWWYDDANPIAPFASSIISIGLVAVTASKTHRLTASVMASVALRVHGPAAAEPWKAAARSSRVSPALWARTLAVAEAILIVVGFCMQMVSDGEGDLLFSAIVWLACALAGISLLAAARRAGAEWARAEAGAARAPLGEAVHGGVDSFVVRSAAGLEPGDAGNEPPRPPVLPSHAGAGQPAAPELPPPDAVGVTEKAKPPAPRQPPSGGSRFCVHCGFARSGLAPFCGNCGERFA